MSSPSSKLSSSSTGNEFVPLNQLSLGSGCSVKVMICRSWDSINSYGKHIATEYIISDDKGNAIQCSVRSNIAHCFVGKLLEGHIFCLKNFSVVANKEKFRIRNTDQYAIELEGYTVVRKIEGSDAGFDRHPFQLTSFVAIELNDSSYLIDVIGYVVDVGKVRTTQKGSDLLDCHIMNDRGARLRVTLWGSLCNDLIKRKGKSEHYVVIFPSMNIKEFRGELYLSSTSATAIFDDSSISHIASFLELIRNGNNPEIFTMESQPETKKGTLANLLSVQQVMQDGKTNKPIELHCSVRFVRVHTRNSWYYYACGQGNCKKGVTKLGNKFWCGTCKKDSQFPRTSYRLHVEVADTTGSVVVTLFDNIAEELLQKSAAQLLAEVGDDDNDSVLPQAILDLMNTTHILELRSRTYFKNSAYESFTASKLIRPTLSNEELINPSPAIDDNKGTKKRQRDDTVDPNAPPAKAALLAEYIVAQSDECQHIKATAQLLDGK